MSVLGAGRRKGRTEGCEQRRRLRRACALVALTLGAIPVADAFLTAGGEAEAQAVATEAGLSSAPVVGASDPFAALEVLEGQAAAWQGASPSREFLEEVGVPEGARDLRIDGTGRVVGYVLDDGPEQALDRLTRAMEDKGWTAVPLGQVTGATFVKQEGDLRWVLVTCTQAGDETGVVARTVEG